MRVEFDPAKDAVNQAKHGVFLDMAGDLDREAALVWVDEAPRSSPTSSQPVKVGNREWMECFVST